MSRLARPIQRLSTKVSENVKAYRFVTWAGAYPAADGGAVKGPTTHAGDSGEQVDVVTLGTATVEAAGVIAAHVEVQADDEGKAMTRAGGGKAAGVAMEAAAAGGDLIEVFIRTES